MVSLWVVPEELEEAAASPYAYEACKAATYVLWAFSGRKFHGTRTVTERYECPCRSSDTITSIRPYLDGRGGVYNGVLSSSVGGCGCAGTVAGRHARLRLRGTPVRKVSRVSRDGVDLPSDAYKIVNGSILQLTGTAQDVCGLEVTYTYGVGIPVSGQRAARSLARELVKGWSGSEDCMLPDRVTNVSRQGISFTVMDPQDFLEDGRTGVYEVDLFLRASNPDKARKPARVFSVDKPKAYRVTSGKTTQVLGPLDWSITPGEPATWSINLVEQDADLLLSGSWNPQGQITSWNGAVLLEFDASRFSIANGVLTVTLTADETLAVQAGSAAWDLYGISSHDGYTLIHVLSSAIHTTGE